MGSGRFRVQPVGKGDEFFNVLRGKDRLDATDAPPTEAAPIDTSSLNAVRGRAPSSRRRGASAPSPATSDAPEAAPAEGEQPAEPASTEGMQTVRRSGPKIGRNDPCPCGSGKKYKVCHGQAGAEGPETPTKTENA